MQITGQRKNKKAKSAPVDSETTFVALFAPSAHETPLGIPVRAAAGPPPAFTPVPSDAPFTAKALVEAVEARIAGEPAGSLDPERHPGFYKVTETKATVPEANIALLEPEAAAAASVPFAALSSEAGQLRLKAVLDSLGFAIVTGVLDAAEVCTAERLFADDLRSIVDPVRSTNVEALSALMQDPLHAWPMDKLHLGEKFCSNWGLPQGRAAWFVRSHPKTTAVFQSIFGDVPLCTGTDNVFFSNTAVTQGHSVGSKNRLWPHSDQNSGIKPSGQVPCFQGVMYIWPATDDTSATVVWPRSNELVYPGLMARGQFKRHFCRLPTLQAADFARNARRVPVPPGAMLLWDSKTIHQGWSGGPRLAIPVCCEPQSRRDHNVVVIKTNTVLAGAPSTHWASIGEVHPIATMGDTLEVDGVFISHKAHRQVILPDGSLHPIVQAML